MEQTPILVVEEIHAGYSNFDVLHGVSLHVHAGEIVTIIGPNGAGKSTTLKAIMGLIKVRQGRVLIHGQAVEHLRPVQRLAHGLTIVPQGRSNFPKMTIVENLEMAGFILPPKKLAARIAAILDTFPMLATKRNQQAGTLSGGQQQFLEMAMAMVLDPAIVMLDEPSLGLDPLNYEVVFDYIKEIQATGVVILMVEQNAVKALSISDRAYVLEQGRNGLDGPAHTILDNPEVKRLYLGG